ncbi:hypothetical protein CL619_02310 [archaeon]|nr:hypothetical protein [archaeon]|tara:strand:- start:4104 stop:4877 length:774 start_codon:yes stop_codon:yes gene_type:complete
MGAEKVCESWQIKDNVGLYLFGDQNYQAVEQVVSCDVPGDFNLHLLAEILGNSFPAFPNYVDRIADLYETVMQHAGPLEESRAAHRQMDGSIRKLAEAHLNGPGSRVALNQEMQELGYDQFSAWFTLNFGQVPKEALQGYLRKSSMYEHMTSEARENLEFQLGLLESVGSEMDEFARLLTRDIRDVTSTIMAKNEVQVALGQRGYKKACQLNDYINGAIAMVPKFCQRRDSLRKELRTDSNQGVYLCDNLRRLDLII